MDSEVEQQQPLQASHLAEEFSQLEHQYVRRSQQCKNALYGVEGVGLLIQRTLMICIELHYVFYNSSVTGASRREK